MKLVKRRRRDIPQEAIFPDPKSVSLDFAWADHGRHHCWRSSAGWCARTAIGRAEPVVSTPDRHSLQVCVSEPVHRSRPRTGSANAGALWMGFPAREIIHRRVAQMDDWGVRVRIWSPPEASGGKSVIDELEWPGAHLATNKGHRAWCSASTTVAAPRSPTPAPRSRAGGGRISSRSDRVTEKMTPTTCTFPEFPDCLSGDPPPASSARRTSAVGGRLRRA